MSSIAKRPQPTTGDVAEARREALRRDPAVIVHRRTKVGPFVSQIHVAHPVDVLDLMGRCEPDDSDDQDRACE